MLIKRLEIISFGKFKNKILDLSDGLNVICGNNESGKSTIISFIYAMLYGFGDNRGKGLSLREKYTPWDGGVCEGKILIKTDDGETITIYRKAGSIKKHDILKVYLTDSGTEVFRSPEDIIGINGETFLKTLCIRQLSSAFSGSNDEIASKLSNIAGSGDENVSYEKAVKILDNLRREIQPQRGEGGLLLSISRQIDIAQKEKSELENTKAELDGALALLPDATEALKKAKEEYEKESLKDYSSSIAHLCGRLEEKEKNSLDKGHTFKNTPDIFIMSGIILLIISVFSFASFLKFSLATLALSIIIFSVRFSKKAPVQSKDDEIDKLKFEIERLKAESNIHTKKLSKLKGNLTLAEENLSKLKLHTESLKLSCTKFDEGFLTELTSKKKILQKKLRAITLASLALSSAYEKIQRDFTPALNKKASKYFSIICGGKYTNIFCDEQFNLSIESTIPRESSFFSGGTVDQLYLSLRLALTDMLFENTSSCMILDQPFLQYDKSRIKNTVTLLENMQKNRQTLLFTDDKDAFLTNKQTEILT